MPDLISAFIPLASLILLGYILGRCTTTDLKSVANLAILGFTPLVGLGAAAQLKFNAQLLVLPVITFMLASAVGLITFYFARPWLDKKMSALLPVASGSGNTGYFGLPVALAIMGPSAAGVYMLANLGVVIFETTLGYFFIARGQVDTRLALQRVLKLPLLYALVAGLIISALDTKLPDAALNLWQLAKGAYVCVGMMILGLALSQQKRFRIDSKLLLAGFGGKFILWPTLAVAFVSLDHAVLGLLNPVMHQCILIISAAPMAANLPAYAAQNNAEVAPAATLTLFSTMAAVVGLPYLLPYLLG